jgi:hypothetical protein
MNEVSRPVQFAVPTAAVRATPTNEKEKKEKKKKKLCRRKPWIAAVAASKSIFRV